MNSKQVKKRRQMYRTGVHEIYDNEYAILKDTLLKTTYKRDFSARIFYVMTLIMLLGIVIAGYFAYRNYKAAERFKAATFFGYNFLKLQYPQMEKRKYNIIKRACAKYNDQVRKMSGGKVGTSEIVICAIIDHETIQTWSSTITSPAGAVGEMQLMYKTAENLKVKNRTDPEQNIDGGLRHFYFVCMPKANYDIEKALQYYHGGHNREVQRPIDFAYSKACMNRINKTKMLALAML